jgi:hypothetical protein
MSLEPGLIGFAGLTSLSLTMKKHRGALPPPARLTPGRARVLGWVLIAASVALACAGFGVGMGIVAWIGQLSVAGVLLILVMSWRPNWAPAAAILALAAAPLFSLGA